MKYLKDSEVVGVKTEYNNLTKLSLYISHTLHGLSGLISEKLYNKLDKIDQNIRKLLP